MGIGVKRLAYLASGDTCPQFVLDKKIMKKSMKRHEHTRQKIINKLEENGYNILAGYNEIGEALAEIVINALGGLIKLSGRPDLVVETPENKIAIIEIKGTKNAISEGAILQLSAYMLALEISSKGFLIYHKYKYNNKIKEYYEMVGIEKILDNNILGRLNYVSKRPSIWPPKGTIALIAFLNNNQLIIEKVKINFNYILNILKMRPEVLSRSKYFIPGPYCNICANYDCPFADRKG